MHFSECGQPKAHIARGATRRDARRDATAVQSMVFADMATAATVVKIIRPMPLPGNGYQAKAGWT
jgi:hypothetical protein